jgi:hypothetical protein
MLAEIYTGYAPLGFDPSPRVSARALLGTATAA